MSGLFSNKNSSIDKNGTPVINRGNFLQCSRQFNAPSRYVDFCPFLSSPLVSYAFCFVPSRPKSRSVETRFGIRLNPSISHPFPLPFLFKTSKLWSELRWLRVLIWSIWPNLFEFIPSLIMGRGAPPHTFHRSPISFLLPITPSCLFSNFILPYDVTSPTISVAQLSTLKIFSSSLPFFPFLF